MVWLPWSPPAVGTASSATRRHRSSKQRTQLLPHYNALLRGTLCMPPAAAVRNVC